MDNKNWIYINMNGFWIMLGSIGGAKFLIANSIDRCCRKSSSMFSEPLPFMNENAASSLCVCVFFSLFPFVVR